VEARRFLVATASLAAVALAAPGVAAAITYTVARADDSDGPCPFPDNCSLRQAINSANASTGSDRIVFDIPPGGPQTIRPLARNLPPVTDPVEIDGTTQPGYAGAPIVELDGSLDPMLPNYGLEIQSGYSTVRGLLIDGFAGDGAAIFLAGPHNLVAGNYVGDVPGTAATAPNSYGVRTANSPDNQIGGSSANDRNVVSGNTRVGIFVGDGSPSNVVQGNYVGTDPTGQTGIPGVQATGIQIEHGDDSLVGGTNAGTGNVVSLNGEGVFVNAVNVQVQGNLIGTDSTGTRPLGNTFGVTLIGSSGAEIGGGSTSARNVIADNEEAGVFLESQSSDNAVQGNWIGVGADGRPLGNHGDGVFVGEFAHTNLIGGTGPGQGNLIAFNGGRGVALRVDAGLQNGILANSIHSNGSLGIDLLANGGENPNDPDDVDTGPNDLQNWPLLTSAAVGNGETKVDGTLNSHPGTTYLLEFFGSSACDGSGFGEGQNLLADRFVTTDAAGNATFSFTLASQAGNFITATATDPDTNTSEFSDCTQAAQLVVGSVTTLSPPNAVNPVGTTHTVTATAVTAGTASEPLAGVTVFFTVSGSVDTTGRCTTDQTGQCSFTYQGPSAPGADVIRAYADANGNGVEDPGEIEGVATKEWTIPASAPGQVTGGGQAPAVDGRIVFGFNAQNQNNGVKGNCNVIDVAFDVHVKCLTVTALVISGTHATFSGEATVNGVATDYQIDVDDLAEPGQGRDMFKVQTGSGYAAGGPLTAGNVQIHP
jgi:hypothetical protein